MQIIRYLILVSFFLDCTISFSQKIVQSIIINEVFSNNDRGWPIINTDSLDLSINNGQYYINFDPSYVWNKSVSLPEDIRNSFESDEVEMSFTLKIDDRNGQPYSGVGFIFDQSGGNYNLLYIGEEAGRIFSSIIPRRGQFLAPIKDGKGTNFSLGKFYTIKLRKKGGIYEVLIDDKLILSFIHKDQIQFSKLYFTVGKYSFSDFKITASSLSINQQEFESHAKVFDPSSNKVYILLAGIDNYSGNGLPPLNSPVNDIRRMKEFWQSVQGGNVPSQNIIFLPDGKATRENIINYSTNLALTATGNDVIIMYFSGHGTNSGAFCCYNNNYLYFKEISQIVNLSKAKNKLVIVDACHAGLIKNIISAPGKDILSPQDLNSMFYFGVSTASKGTNYLLSCGANEISFDGTANSNSVFTSALLQVLNNTTGRQSGQILTLSQVYNSLKAYFDDWNRKNFGKTYTVNINNTGVRTQWFYPISMTPQLLPQNSNSNLPFTITK